MGIGQSDNVIGHIQSAIVRCVCYRTGKYRHSCLAVKPDVLSVQGRAATKKADQLTQVFGAWTTSTVVADETKRSVCRAKPFHCPMALTKNPHSIDHLGFLKVIERTVQSTRRPIGKLLDLDFTDIFVDNLVCNHDGIALVVEVHEVPAELYKQTNQWPEPL
jgi:hypothetical protein